MSRSISGSEPPAFPTLFVAQAKSRKEKGQRTLSRFAGEDLDQEGVVPAAAAAFHGEAVATGMLLEE